MPLYDMWESAGAICGCSYQGKPGCPEGRVCCSCGPCLRKDICLKSCGNECDVTASCGQSMPNLGNA